MIVMKAAKNVEIGDVISTDGLVVDDVYHPFGLPHKYALTGVCHGVRKVGYFDEMQQVPIYVKDEE